MRNSELTKHELQLARVSVPFDRQDLQTWVISEGAYYRVEQNTAQNKSLKLSRSGDL